MITISRLGSYAEQCYCVRVKSTRKIEYPSRMFICLNNFGQRRISLLGFLPAIAFIPDLL